MWRRTTGRRRNPISSPSSNSSPAKPPTAPSSRSSRTPGAPGRRVTTCGGWSAPRTPPSPYGRIPDGAGSARPASPRWSTRPAICRSRTGRTPCGRPSSAGRGCCWASTWRGWPSTTRAGAAPGCARPTATRPPTPWAARCPPTGARDGRRSGGAARSGPPTTSATTPSTTSRRWTNWSAPRGCTPSWRCRCGRSRRAHGTRRSVSCTSPTGGCATSRRTRRR